MDAEEQQRIEAIFSRYDELKDALADGSYLWEMLDNLKQAEYAKVGKSPGAATEAHYNVKAIEKVRSGLNQVRKDYEFEQAKRESEQ